MIKDGQHDLLLALALFIQHDHAALSKLLLIILIHSCTSFMSMFLFYAGQEADLELDRDS